MVRPICSVEGCFSPHKANGFCVKHNYRWLKHGDPLGGRTENGESHRYFNEIVLAYEGTECLPWPYSKDGAGYGRIWVEGGQRRVSRWVCEIVHGPAPTPEHEAAHSCGKGDEACVTKRHLSWKTRKENEDDKLLHGTIIRGESHRMAKLNSAQVIEILGLSKVMTRRDIAARFGVCHRSINDIVTGKTWKHITAKSTQQGSHP